MISPGPTELIIILAIVLLLFGAKRLPDLMRSLGKGVDEFKKGVKGEGEDNAEESGEKAPPEGEGPANQSE